MAGLVCVAFLGLLAPGEIAVIVVTSLCAIAVFSGIAAAELRRTADLIRPSTVILIWCVIVLGVAPLGVAGVLSRYGSLQFVTASLSVDEVQWGYAICLCGAVSLYFGIIGGGGARRVGRDAVSSGSVSLGVVAACVGVCISVALLGGELTGDLGGVALPISMCGPAALACYGISAGRDRNAFGLSVVFVGSILLAFANGGRGSKLGVINGFIPLFLALFSIREARKWILMCVPFLAGLQIVVLTPTVMTARETFGNDNVEPHHLLQILTTVVVPAIASDFVGHTEKAQEMFVTRAFESAAAGYIYRRTEQEGFLYGETLDYMTWGWVPRVIWPDKPIVNRGRWFSLQLGLASTESAIATSTGMTPFGELYWNFGIPGVIVGMFVIGVLIRRVLIELAGEIPAESVVNMMPYVHVLMSAVLYLGTEAGSTVISIVQAFVMYVLLIRLKASVSMLRTR